MTSQIGEQQASLRSPEEIEWSDYSHHYDLMCELNPSYQANIDLLIEYLAQWNLPHDATVCDLGAGTGNYISALSKRLPDAQFTHVDSDPEMNDLAAAKYQSNNVNVHMVDAEVQEVGFPANSFDLVICVNALYAISPRRQVLGRVRSWLKPGGKFFVIDFGRPNRPLDWFWYVTRSSLKTHGLVETTKAVLRSVDLVRAQAKGRKAQDAGRYWIHSTEEFVDTLEENGFDVEAVKTCYRDYCDLAVCRKRSS